MKNKITALPLFLVVGIMLVATSASAARVIEARDVTVYQEAVIDNNLIVRLDNWGSDRMVAHDETAYATHEIKIFAVHYPKSKYQSLSYSSATIEVEGAVRKQLWDRLYSIIDAGDDIIQIPTSPEWLSGPGKVYLRILATTNVDKRKPPKEERRYTIIVHLKDMKAKTHSGEVISLGDFDVVFKDYFEFLHNPGKFSQSGIIDGICGGGVIKSKWAETTANGPTPTAKGENWEVWQNLGLGESIIIEIPDIIGTPEAGQPVVEPVPISETPLLEVMCLNHRNKQAQ